MVEKGKGVIIGKLRTIQLIEADLQIIMRICINNWNKYHIENDPRISKCNYGFYLNYSIEMVIFGKKLIYDASTLNQLKAIYNMTDLEACFNRQLANASSVLQELIKIERVVIKLISKVLSIFERHICTSYSISKQFYGGTQDKQGGTSQ